MTNTKLTSYDRIDEHVAIAIAETQDNHTLIPRNSTRY